MTDILQYHQNLKIPTMRLKNVLYESGSARDSKSKMRFQLD